MDTDEDPDLNTVAIGPGDRKKIIAIIPPMNLIITDTPRIRVVGDLTKEPHL